MRDRATLHLAQLGGKAGGPKSITSQPDLSLASLERSLGEYIESQHTEQPFDMVGGVGFAGGGQRA